MQGSDNKEILRRTSETLFSEELEQLKKFDHGEKPAQWNLSPSAVVNFILGVKLPNGITISPKYFGQRKLIEIAVSSLLSDRALLLTGIPGTAKTWLSEHLAAAISGNSTLLIQGTSGTHEDLIKYGWNYASLIANGPTKEGLIPSPVLNAMNTGTIARIEEISRIPTETQDALISILSEKTISIPELNTQILAKRGFNIIATSNDMDRGIYEMSSALKRRFNIITMPLPQTSEEEVEIVNYRVNQLGRNLEINLAELKQKQLQKLVTLFRELREGKSEDGKTKIRATKAQLSPAVAISILHEARIFAHYFDKQEIKAEHIIPGLINTMLQESSDEMNILQEYNETILKKRPDYKDWYTVIKNIH
ncbi:MAG: AAA family ATPase [Saprospiraceae bacterium]